jgi:hypothetical protein
VRVERTVWAHETIRCERQHDKGRAGEDQGVLEFIFREDRADEAVQPGSGGEQSSNRNRQACRQRRPLHRKPAEQGSHNQGNFGRQAGVVFVPTPIRNRSHQDHAGDRGRVQHLAANDEAERAGKRSNRERTYSCRRTRRACAFAALSFRTDQQADPKRQCEVQDHGVKDQHILRVSRHPSTV